MNSFLTEKELKLIGFLKIGKNVLISRNAFFYNATEMEIGNNVRIDDNVIFSGKIVIGEFVHIAASCLFFGGTEGIYIEDFVGVSSRTAIYASTDDYSGEYMANPMIPDKFRNVTSEKIIIKKHSIIGSGSTVLPGVTIGEGCAVGAMSLINKSLNEWGMYVGIPCKKIRERKKNLLKYEKIMKNEEMI